MDAGTRVKKELAAALEERATRGAERKLHEFLRQAWHVVEPHRGFKDNWHIGAECEHLEAVSSGQIKLLVINQPPATTKSLTVSVVYPAWEWVKRAWIRFLCASCDQNLSLRDNLRMRALITSEWYQARWPGVQLSEEQNQKTRFETTRGGWRIATSIGGRLIGEHPHVKIIDDPHDPKKQLLSDAEIQQAIEWYDFGMKTRGATLNAATILIMQRLHEKDLSGHILGQLKELGGVHLCLPMRWEPKRMACVGPLFWRDPREGKPGALLWPEEWPEDKCTATFKPETWGDAGQFQQRPAPAGGLMFKRSWFDIVHALPADVIGDVRSWDVAGTEDGDGAQTVGLRMCRTSGGRFIITSVIKGRWTEDGVDKVMRQTAELDGPMVAVREEQEPGSAGKAVIRARRRALVGFDYRGLPACADKVTRARPLRSQAEGGNVQFLVRLDEDGRENPHDMTMVREFLDEIELFPAGALKDQVDAASQALNVLAGVIDEDLVVSSGTEENESEMTPQELEAKNAAAKAAAEQAVLDAIQQDGAYWPSKGPRTIH